MYFHSVLVCSYKYLITAEQIWGKMPFPHNACSLSNVHAWLGLRINIRTCTHKWLGLWKRFVVRFLAIDWLNATSIPRFSVADGVWKAERQGHPNNNQSILIGRPLTTSSTWQLSTYVSILYTRISHHLLIPKWLPSATLHRLLTMHDKISEFQMNLKNWIFYRPTVDRYILVSDRRFRHCKSEVIHVCNQRKQVRLVHQRLWKSTPTCYL